MYQSETWKSSENHSAIQMCSVRHTLLAWESEDPEAFRLNFELAEFRSRYASDNQVDGNPFAFAKEVEPGHAEWQRKLLFTEKEISAWLLCCPEDVVRGRSCKHAEHELCFDCEIPLCKSCCRKWWKHGDHKIPMALSNDNFWGYAADIITKHRVRWIEAGLL